MNLDSPVFIFGALRSGTTLFRIMLNAHAEVTNPGEANAIFDSLKFYLGRKEWTYDFETLQSDLSYQDLKLTLPPAGNGEDVLRNFVGQLFHRSSGVLTLNVHRNLDKIASLFPDSKIIHIVRDPRDVARSCIGMGWAGNTYFAIDSWIATERNWNAFSSAFHEANIMQITYEDLISRPRDILENVCEFLGVSFSGDMLSYSNSSTYNLPDSSLIQAWKTKLSPREIALVEIKTECLLVERGYSLSGYSLNSPSWFAKQLLHWHNRHFKLGFACRRYGVFNVVMERVTRKLSLPLHRVFIDRINSITRQHLK